MKTAVRTKQWTATILPYPVSVPEFFIRKVVVLLNRGSIHTSVNKDHSLGFREDLLKAASKPYLNAVDLFSLGTLLPPLAELPDQQLAIITLLVRFKDVLSEATENDKLYQNMPLPRTKIAEITFVLKAIAT
ncbi:Uncharacterized protein FKW44_018469, partial [Caligus rogercresseyi]